MTRENLDFRFWFLGHKLQNLVDEFTGFAVNSSLGQRKEFLQVIFRVNGTILGWLAGLCDHNSKMGEFSASRKQNPLATAEPIGQAHTAETVLAASTRR